MKGFIEVTDYDGGMKVLLPVSKITAIVCDDDGSVFVELGLNNKGDSSGLLVTESYDEIKEKIKQTECSANGNFISKINLSTITVSNCPISKTSSKRISLVKCAISGNAKNDSVAKRILTVGIIS